MEMDQWLKDVRASINMWSLQKTAHGVPNQMATEIFMRRKRRRLQARHIWEKIESNWPMIRGHSAIGDKPWLSLLAVLTALVQSILEGRTDCPISGVFGAGKTRSAAAMIAGLLVMDPSLKVMVVTKENAAAHAFAKHIESLQLPPSLEEKFGRLVGATELETSHGPPVWCAP